MDIKKSLKDVIVLTLICVVFAGALAVTNELTKDTISAKKAAAETAAYEVVMPDAKGFENVDITGKGLPSTIVEIKKETSGLGHVVKLQANGYQPGLVILIAVNPDGVVTAATCLESKETWGLESEMSELVVGTDANTIVDIKAGVTSLTVNAYRGAVRDALNALILLGGGEVDNRTEAEIFEDKLEAAVGDEDADFTGVYVADNKGNICSYSDLKVTGIYEATNGKGYVFVIGTEFVGVDSEGTILTETTDDNKKIVNDAFAIINNAGYTDVDTTEYQNSEDRNVKRVFKSIVVKYNAENEVYLITADVQGYNSNVKVTMYVTVGADGKLIDSFAVNHSESNGYGADQFKDGVYNSNFVGKDAEEADGVDTVAGVTVSTKAYKNAVVNALKAVSILTTADNTTEGGTN